MRRKEVLADLIDRVAGLDEYRAYVLSGVVARMDGSGCIARSVVQSLCDELFRDAMVRVCVEDFTAAECPLLEQFDDGQALLVSFGVLGLDVPDHEGEYVYFARCGATSAVKVGRSADVARRLSELQTANPARLELLAVVRGGLRMERMIHREFARDRIRGEWFRPSPELLAFVRELRGKL